MTFPSEAPNHAAAYVLDGKAVSQDIVARVGAEASVLGVRPGLAVVLVGEDPASRVYVGAKGKAAKACGFHSLQYDLASDTSEADLLALVERLNADPAVHGILVQLPLPKAINSAAVLEAVAPRKDVDGFHPINVGLAAIGEFGRALIPCTPAGAMILIDRACAALGQTLDGKEAVIIGRSNIVGKPMAQLLLQRNCTVTIAHSRTRDLADVARRADILVAAVGRAEMVRGDWVKPGAVVIDVGINRVAGQGVDAAGRPKTRLVGDVAYQEAATRAGAITPVPGGVGPMTIAMLMANTLIAACRASGVEPPKF
jgi:methylenetetrahydrofolate dehydrogenase (NADP+) / methenyltetrahydrofolate cyclohydrolase